MAEHNWLDEHIELYVLGALDDDEVARVEREIAAEPAAEQARYRSEISRTREALVSLSAAHAIAPPPRIREQLLAELPAPQETPKSAGAQSRPGTAGSVVDLDSRRRRMFMATGAVAAAAVLIFGGVLVGRVTAPDAAAPVAQSEIDKQLGQVLQAPDMQLQQDVLGEDTSVTVVASRAANQAVVMADGLPVVPEGQTYQMWLLGDDREPLSLGLMQGSPGRQALALDNLSGSTGIGVTVEPEGGSPQPTGDPVVELAF